MNEVGVAVIPQNVSLKILLKDELILEPVDGKKRELLSECSGCYRLTLWCSNRFTQDKEFICYDPSAACISALCTTKESL